MGIRKTVLPLFFMAVAIAIAVAGCSDTPDQNNANSSPKKGDVANKVGNQKPTTVTANSSQQPTQGPKALKTLPSLRLKTTTRQRQLETTTTPITR
jgi:hypothetical protein